MRSEKYSTVCNTVSNSSLENQLIMPSLPMELADVRMAQWIRRLPTEQEILGSSPSTDSFFFCVLFFSSFLCICVCM